MRTTIGLGLLAMVTGGMGEMTHPNHRRSSATSWGFVHGISTTTSSFTHRAACPYTQIHSKRVIAGAARKNLGLGAPQQPVVRGELFRLLSSLPPGKQEK